MCFSFKNKDISKRPQLLNDSVRQCYFRRLPRTYPSPRDQNNLKAWIPVGQISVELSLARVLPVCVVSAYRTWSHLGFRVVQLSKALHLSARGVTANPGLNPGCITSDRDWESHRAVHNWPSVIQVWPG
jgi:hypothetical protein